MKKIIICISIFITGIATGAMIAFNNIEIDGVNELDRGVITIKCCGHYFDYYYEAGE